MILVYEYVSATYLSDYLDSDLLTWEKRLRICLDIAHGLNYIHHEMEGQNTVIHRDMNSGNIVLDDNWEAKVVEFGGSIYLPSNQVDDALYLSVPHDFNYYMDPEYYATGKLKRESDVYSFGALMFEIFCGMSAQSVLLKGERLDTLVRGWLDEGILNTKMAPIIEGENSENNFMLNNGPNKDSLDTFINIASHCFAKKQNQRPTMKVIIKELEKALSFQAVSDPPGQVSVKFNDSTSLQTFPPSGAAHGKIASAGGPPRDADGVGLNVDNDKPTTSLNAALRKLNFGYQMQREDITSAFFNKFEHPFHTLINQGFRPLEELYYKTWLHSGQRVVVQEKTKDQDMLMENVVTVQADKSLGQKVASRLNVKPSY